MVFPKEALSVLHFLLYMSKLPKLLRNTCRSLFVDLIQSNFQTSMNELTLSNADHHITQSCTKSVRVLFERQKSKMLTYNSQAIPSSSVKFLGITFDSALTFKSHFHTVATLARHHLIKMNSIFSSTYGPSTSTLIHLLHLYII